MNNDKLIEAMARQACKVRTHQPKGLMCLNCARVHYPCADLPFEQMPVISEHEGVKVVRCTHFVGVKDQPEEAP